MTSGTPSYETEAPDGGPRRAPALKRRRRAADDGGAEDLVELLLLSVPLALTVTGLAVVYVVVNKARRQRTASRPDRGIDERTEGERAFFGAQDDR